MRRKKVNPSDKDVRIDFTDDNGDTWQEFPVLHPKFKEWININFDSLGLSGQQAIEDEMSQDNLQKAFEKSPWYGSTANDIDWEYRLKMQEVLQKYTSHSISSTLNLPENTSVDTVSQIYMKASQMGLKGVTIYREGSRSGVLVDSSKKDKQLFEYNDAPKRPKELPCEIHKTTVKGTEYLVVVGLMKGKPYEVFAQENRWNIKGNHLQGETIKVKKGKYNVQIKDDLLIEDFTSNMKPIEEDITRGYSFGLRHGGSIVFAVEQLNKSESSMVEFSKAIARVLKRYIPDDTVIKESLESCETPDQCNVVFEEGCKKCNTCGISKC